MIFAWMAQRNPKKSAENREFGAMTVDGGWDEEGKTDDRHGKGWRSNEMRWDGIRWKINGGEDGMK